MKEARALRGSPTDQSLAARPMATITPAEVPIRRNGNCCSPRTNVAFAALDAVQSIASLLSRFLPACKTGVSGIHDAKKLPMGGCDNEAGKALGNTPRQ